LSYDLGEHIWWPARMARREPDSDAGMRNETETEEAGVR